MGSTSALRSHRLPSRRSTLRLVAAFASVLAVLASSFVAAAPVSAAGTASLSGTVLGAGGAPLESVCVWSPTAGGTSTDAAGTFTFSGLDAGSYKLQFSDCSASPQYVSEWFNGATSEAGATEVPVADGESVVLPAVQLDAGVVFSGTVTDAGGAPLEGISVSVMSTSTPDGGWAVTAADGTYRSTPVRDGTYRVQFTDPSPTYAREFWNGTFLWNAAELLTVAAADGPERAGVDASMELAGSLSGTVTDSGGAPLAQVCVTAVDAVTYDWLASTETDAAGDWTLGSVAPTTAKVQFRDCSSSPSLVETWWDAAPSFESATVISVPPGSTTAGIDAAMVAGVVVSGTVTDAGGAPLEGISVSVISAGGSSGGWAATAADGTYRSTAVPAGSYRVQFRDDSGVFASEYFDDQPTWDSAVVLELSGTERPGVDASLVAGARVTGQVSTPGGGPAAGVCVNVLRGDRSAPQWVGGAQTDAAGGYSVGGLPPGDSWVQFLDCAATGPYRTQFFDGVRDLAAASTLALTSGEVRSGVDATLEFASTIAGVVSGPGGAPLSGVCVQASTASTFGDLVRTDASGAYRLLIEDPGRYRVQFVDCGTGAHAGVWFGGGAEPSSAQWVDVAEGAEVTGVDAELVAASGPSSVSGTVSNVRGDGLAACAVLFLPDEVALFAETDADGRFRFDDVPSGSWFVAAAGCGPSGPTPTVPDVGGTGVAFAAEWFDDVAVDWGVGAPDPFSQGATLVTVTPGADVVTDTCFGCDALAVESVSPARGATVEVSLELAGVDAGTAAVSFGVSCEAPGSPAVSASSASALVTVSGLAAGVSYSCTASAVVAGLVVASSAPFSVDGPEPTPPAPPSPPAPPAPVPGPTNPVSDGSPAASGLATTGSDLAGVLVLGVTLVTIGLALSVATWRERRRRRPRAPRG